MTSTMRPISVSPRRDRRESGSDVLLVPSSVVWPVASAHIGLTSGKVLARPHVCFGHAGHPGAGLVVYVNGRLAQ